MRHHPTDVIARRSGFGFDRWLGWNSPYGYARQRGAQNYYQRPQDW
jgi:hypothetical protein